MALKDMFRSETSFFGLEIKSKEEVLEFLSDKFLANNIVNSYEDLLQALNDRESQDSTGIGDGIAIPHALNPCVLKSTIGFVRLKDPIDWQSLDGSLVDLVFLIATNGSDGNEHLTALSGLSQVLVKPENQEKLRQVNSFEELQEIFSEKPEEEKPRQEAKPEHYELVGVTACPTGIAHTYLAQEKLLEIAKQLGVSAKIETQGRRGVEDRLTPDDINNAKYIILAHDKDLEGMDRFNGKEVIDTSTQNAIYHTKDLIADYDKQPKKKIKAKKTDDSVGELDLKKFKDFKGVLLAGVSKMLPFVVAGGILLGLAFLIDFIALKGDVPVNDVNAFGTVNKGAGWFAGLGKVSMSMMVPILAAYVAYALVGTQGLMPGLVAGIIANQDTLLYVKNGPTPDAPWTNLWGRLLPSNLETNSGFLGGIAGAYLAGILVFGLTMAFRNFSKSWTGVRDIVLIPVLSLLGVGVGMFALNIPLGYAMYGIEWLLKQLALHNLLILAALILGIMVCVDMGGPINKIAYVIGVLSVTTGDGGIGVITDGANQTNVLMAAVMLAGMMPPLAIAFSTQVFRKAWTNKQRDAAKANWVMGLSFVTEGAIPFMIDDYKRVAVSSMVGGACVGLLAGGLKIGMPAPHGGIFVSPLAKSYLFSENGIAGNGGAAVGFGIAMYILIPFIGMVIAGSMMGAWRSHDIKKGKLQLTEA
ncbi:PTS fructose transporter subunit IIABC [Mesoplasma lactucae]|uniref:PTS fructose transporter subunit IIABC n=1 Tax=Mesoplasma lactucae ATCC 49193 TaxID=81460 RepID=A0A291IQZ1_9MOLU|nr:fructose-specific PTS transporter subunit EIIC [Mesoplasma lactucae]ATG97209.1 PTS fructose transporter subunit IIABC [Mesoplasma lactucae ATCC 49193]ATZ20349.1 PTS system, fructose-specific IIABC component [Mesoplasma lactucae ATCC 49193]MCL8216520.1 PTS system fructose-specific EIIABC component [Mesoplasma lactucae ATCC 49193]